MMLNSFCRVAPFDCRCDDAPNTSHEISHPFHCIHKLNIPSEEKKAVDTSVDAFGVVDVLDADPKDDNSILSVKAHDALDMLALMILINSYIQI
jgi:hypothetical protein